MLRTTWGLLVAAALGGAAGYLLAGTLGAALGAVLGTLVRTAWVMNRNPARPVPEDARPERVRVLCIPKGEPAECVIYRDPRTGEWLDVERCALAEPETEIRCHRKCLELLNEAPAAQPAER